MSKRYELRIPVPATAKPGYTLQVRVNKGNTARIKVPEDEDNRWDSTEEEMNKGKRYLRLNIGQDELIPDKPVTPKSIPVTEESPEPNQNPTSNDPNANRTTIPPVVPSSSTQDVPHASTDIVQELKIVETMINRKQDRVKLTYRDHYVNLHLMLFICKFILGVTFASLISLNWWGALASILPAAAAILVYKSIESAIEASTLNILDFRIPIDLCIGGLVFGFIFAFLGLILPPSLYIWTIHRFNMFITTWSVIGGVISILQFTLCFYLMKKCFEVSKDTPFTWRVCHHFTKHSDVEHELKRVLVEEVQELKRAISLCNQAGTQLEEMDIPSLENEAVGVV